MAEIKAMEAWLLANPNNTKSNYERFITNWLKRAQDKAPRKDTNSGYNKKPIEPPEYKEIKFPVK